MKTSPTFWDMWTWRPFLWMMVPLRLWKRHQISPIWRPSCHSTQSMLTQSNILKKKESDSSAIATCCQRESRKSSITTTPDSRSYQATAFHSLTHPVPPVHQREPWSVTRTSPHFAVLLLSTRTQDSTKTTLSWVTYHYLTFLNESSYSQCSMQEALLFITVEMLLNWRMTWLWCNLLCFWVFQDYFRDSMMCCKLSSRKFKDTLRLLWIMQWELNWVLYNHQADISTRFTTLFSSTRQNKPWVENADWWSVAVLHYCLTFKTFWKSACAVPCYKVTVKQKTLEVHSLQMVTIQ